MTNELNAEEIIRFISESEKKTPVKVWYNASGPVYFPNCKTFGHMVTGDWKDIRPVLESGAVDDYVIENDCRNSAVPLLDLLNLNARIEPGAIIRDMVSIGNGAVIMMGAVLNIGAVVGDDTMVDMNAILGGRAIVGRHCHIGAGAVLAGVVEPASATPVVIEDDVMIGANAVVIEGCRVGRGAVVAAGAVVIEDVPPYAVVAGCPATVIKMKDEKSAQKTELVDALRRL